MDLVASSKQRAINLLHCITISEGWCWGDALGPGTQGVPYDQIAIRPLHMDQTSTDHFPGK